jgi:hypothetical protein
MAFQTVFKRYELKYMITREQKDRILRAMEPYMVQDKFGRSTIRNIYFDTDDYILARHSIAKPDFKEKLRIRSYAAASPDSTVFVELKRKFDNVVYKRRVALPENFAMKWTQGFAGRQSGITSRQAGITDSKTAVGNGANIPHKELAALPPQMTSEINYFLSYYGTLRPAVFLSYDRLAYRMRDADSDFRVTFDENILFRDYDMSLGSDIYGTPLLEDGKVLMEIKCSGGIPLWMTQVLSEEHIYKTSFSKYGTAYSRYIQPAMQREAIALRQIAAAAQAGVQSAPADMGDPTGSGKMAPAGMGDPTGSGKMAPAGTGRRNPADTDGRYSGRHARHRRTASSWLHYLGA